MPHWTYRGHTLFDMHFGHITRHTPLNIPSLDMPLTNLGHIPRIYSLGIPIVILSGIYTLGHTFWNIYTWTYFLYIHKIYSFGHTLWTYNQTFSFERSLLRHSPYQSWTYPPDILPWAYLRYTSLDIPS